MSTYDQFLKDEKEKKETVKFYQDFYSLTVLSFHEENEKNMSITENV